MLKKNISRRDFINGSLMAAGGALLSSPAWGERVSSPYPPLLTGMRGSTDASFKYAHAMAMGGQYGFGELKDSGEEYDLVVVGAGISGLSAAYFYQQLAGKDKKILILDNHDDFGGHARRNEFEINGGTYLNYGGSQTIQEPSDYSKIARGLLKDLTIDIPAFDKRYYDKGFYQRHGLGSVTYFNKKEYGEDKLVGQTLLSFRDFMIGVSESTLSMEGAVEQMPLSLEGKEQLKKVINGKPLQLPAGDEKAVLRYLRKTSYIQYIQEQFGTSDPQVLHMLRMISADNWGMGSDVLSVSDALGSGAPGLNDDLKLKFLGKKALKSALAEEPYIHHFPDGNATIARLLVRRMMPQVASGVNAEDVVMSRFDYGKLDTPESSVRLRLNSTVTAVKHEGDVKGATSVSVSYVNNGKSYKLKAKHCVMACYNMVVPYLVTDLPQNQKAALKEQVKTPLVYTTVMLNNWRSLKEAGIAAASCPGNRHHLVLADFPVSVGKRKFAESPDDPMALTMIHVPVSEKLGMPPKDQFREGRRRLLSTPYSMIENEIVEHLSGMLGPSGFDAEKDIHGITVNRWAHGYTYGGSGIHDTEMWKLSKQGRKAFGLITIANADSGGDAYAGIAIDQAWRAVNEF